jgi:hypothetical protein
LVARDFHSDADDLPDEDDGEPRVALAYWRLREWFKFELD